MLGALLRGILYSFRRKDLDERAREYLYVLPKTEIFGVFRVVGQLFIVADHISAVCLRKSRDAGAKGIDTKLVSLLVDIALLGNKRTRADKAHISAYHIEELRKLVKAGAAQKTPYGRDIALGVAKLRCGHIFRGVLAHSSELVAYEISAILAHPYLFKNNLSW